MKKIFYLFLLPILLVGCSKETEKLSEPSPVGGMISVHSQREFSDGPLSASAIHSDVFTRVAGDAVLAYTFEAWTRDANPRCVLHKTVTGTLTEAVFEIALIPGNYDFLFWADFGKGYYNTSDLRQISFDGIPYMSGSDRDAFACALENVRWNGGNGVGATLKRPLAKLTIQNPRHLSPETKSFGYLPERSDPVRCIDRYGIRSGGDKVHLPDDNNRIGGGRRGFPFRSDCRKVC